MEEVYGPIIKEFSVDTLTVDGFAMKNNLIIEFNGCKFHGHNCDIRWFNKCLMDKDYNREKFLKSRGFNTLFIYQCQFNEMLRQNKEIKQKYIDFYNFHKNLRRKN